MVIGIGGISRAGKTTLAEKLKQHFQGKKLTILHQDTYVLAGYEAPLIRDVFDWEHPGSIDFPRLVSDLKNIKPHVDIMIVEGLFAFTDEKLVELYDKMVYLQLEYSHFFARKKADLRWGELHEWYIQHIWESHQKYGKPQNSEEVFVTSGKATEDISGLMDYLEIT